MKYFIASFLVLLSTTVFAAKPGIYKVVVDLSIDDLKTTSSLVVQEGVKSELELNSKMDGRFSEVTLNETRFEGKKVLEMEFVIGQVDSMGNKTVISTPKIIASVGEKSSVLIGASGNTPGKKLIVSAVAKRVSR